MPGVTRYAPSPSGDLHIGGARTALFNWAFARHEGGSILLRFEDTDRERSDRASEAAVLEALEWLGLDHDPVPGNGDIPRQSERGERYRLAIDALLAGGHAYRCTCTREELEAMRERGGGARRRPGYDRTCRERDIGADCGTPFCVRLAVPESGGLTRWDDLCAGPSGQDAKVLDDFVIARTDGTPIYHLAVVVDDHDMGISHVIRGREHMTSTPRQLLLYQALELAPPRFAHVPLLVNASGKKLSKREAAVSVLSYRERGFCSEAVLNYIARLGWGHGDLEVFGSDELVRHFTLEGVGKSPSQVHEDKLLWLNQQYLRALPTERLIADLVPFVERAAGAPFSPDANFATLVELLRERAKTLPDMAAQARFYWSAELDYDPKAAGKFLVPANREPLAALRAALAEQTGWTLDGLRASFEAVMTRCDVALGKLAQPVRVAITGATASPGIFETLEVLGRERSLARLDAALGRMAD